MSHFYEGKGRFEVLILRIRSSVSRSERCIGQLDTKCSYSQWKQAFQQNNPYFLSLSEIPDRELCMQWLLNHETSTKKALFFTVNGGFLISNFYY
jgi:hypothetical protein